MSLPIKPGSILLCVRGTEDVPTSSIAHGLLKTGEIYLAADVPASIRESLQRSRTPQVRVKHGRRMVTWKRGRLHTWEPDRFEVLGSVR